MAVFLGGQWASLGKRPWSKDVKDVKECPQGGLGEVLSRQRTLWGKWTQAGECLCSRESQEAAGAEGKGTELRSHVWPDPVGLQDVRRGLILSER